MRSTPRQPAGTPPLRSIPFLTRIFHEISARRAETAALACAKAALRGWPRSSANPEPLRGWRLRYSAALNQLSELIQTRRRLNDVEASCNLRANSPDWNARADRRPDH